MTLSGGGTSTGGGPHGSRAARWSLGLGLVTVASIVGFVGATSAPRSVDLILVAVAAAGGLGSMVLGVVSLLPRRNISNRARRQAFAGAVLGSLVLVGIGLSAASAFVFASQANGALTQIASQFQKTVQAQQRCISAAGRSGASAQAAFEECSGSSRSCSSNASSAPGTFLCATTVSGTATNAPWSAVLVLLVWAGLVFGAGWLVFGSRGPPPLTGATT